MTDREHELWELASSRQDKIDELEEQLNKLKAILQAAICKQCGGVSWDIPLADYCKCDRPDKPHLGLRKPTQAEREAIESAFGSSTVPHPE
jgi:hypothetical protein